MAQGDKTRPTDNYHCFKGAGFIYWRAKASGLQPSRETHASRDGHVFDYTPDVDGFAMNNGGIAMPAETTLGLLNLFRFYPSTGQARYAIGGNWWQDLDALKVMTTFALNNDMPLSRAAQLLLIIPKDWGDCANILIAKPTVVLKAFVGKGKAVAISQTGQSTSPDGKRKSGTAVYAASPGNNLEQIYIPGEPALLAQFMQQIATHHIDPRGKISPQIPLTY